jgi:two-component system sensor histidine kinase EvgS
MNAPNNGMAPKRILYIDDDAELALLFKRWLEHGGHTVSTDCNPRHALEALSGHASEFDLVVTDYRMPDIDGIAVARTINQCYPGLRCAVVTGDVSNAMIESATAAGVGPVLRKPFAPREYDDLIRRCTA